MTYTWPDVLIASLVFDVVCVDTKQLQVMVTPAGPKAGTSRAQGWDQQGPRLGPAGAQGWDPQSPGLDQQELVQVLQVMLTRALRWLNPRGLMVVQVVVLVMIVMVYRKI